MCFHPLFTNNRENKQEDYPQSVEAQHPSPCYFQFWPVILPEVCVFVLRHPQQCPRLYPFLPLSQLRLTLYRSLGFHFPEFRSSIPESPVY